MNAKALALQLMSVWDEPVAVADLVRAGAVFGLEAGAVRVALSRLQAAGDVVCTARGRYRLGPAAARLASQVATWRELPARVRPWQGGWIGVATGGLSRTDRGAVRARERALSLLGLRELRPGLQVRPDNRVESVRELRGLLVGLGLEPEAPVFTLGDLGEHQQEALAAWDRGALDAGYAQARAELRVVTRRIASMPLEDAARAVFVAGAAAIRVLAFDPLLPEPMADVAARTALVDEMRAFDDRGRELWYRWMVRLREEAA